jgi:signal transduction histidine kinase/ActR/RegA family two-component response regulator
VPHGEPRLFETEVWTPALDKYAAVTRLTVALYDRAGRLVVGPVNTTPLYDLFADERRSVPYADGLERCLARADRRVQIIGANSDLFGVVCVPLVLNSETVGAAMAGYGLLNFPHSDALERFARQVRISTDRAWEIIRQATPVTKRAFIVQGELLQIFGDTLLRETYRTHQYEETAAELKAAGADKDEFLAVLSHELRTPLTPILGWARILSDDSHGAPIMRAAQSIERNARLQLRLVDDLLELTRVARGKVTLDLKVQDLDDAVQTALGEIHQVAQQQHVTLRRVAGDGSLAVRADADRLQQILRNVFSNAVKFTPSGGTIETLVTRDGRDGVVRIRDNGQGIAADFLPFVFDMFRQQEKGTTRGDRGLGIGLALVKRLTELQDGTVRVDSAGPGTGTEVTLRFPLVLESARAESVPKPQRQNGLRALEGLRILLVEDNEDSRDAIEMMLEYLGAKVSLAGDGVEALAAVDRHDPDIVLCDLRMPRMDGFEFIGQVHAVAGHADLPVIAISGLTSTDDRRRTQAAGFEGHISKPLDDLALAAAVSSVIASRRK